MPSSGYFYTHSGLSVASEIPIPEWDGFETPGSDRVDVAIRARSLGEDYAERDFYADRRMCRFVVHEAGIFSVTRDEIAVDIFPGTDPAVVRIFILGSAWGALCHLRGLLIMHASVVKIGDGAVAFAGESGAGKSSMAAWLSGDGHPIIADDLCRVDLPDEGRPVVYPSSQRVKLWREAIEALGWSGRDGVRDHARVDKFHCLLDQQNVMHSVPLLGIFLLVWGQPRVTRLTGIDALRRLVAASAYRGELLEPLGRLAGFWSDCAEVARRIPVLELSRPHDWSRIFDIMSYIEQQPQYAPNAQPSHDRKENIIDG